MAKRAQNWCGTGNQWFGWLVLLAGVLFLMQDLGTWAFWNLSWYTVAFLLAGAGSLWCKC